MGDVTRRTIGASDRAAVVGAAVTRNRGRYNGNGREWATPPEVFDPLHTEFSFTLDACATPASAKVARFYAEADNGLERSWAGERVWMNPPYGAEVYAWTRKARLEAAAGALVVGLLPASTDLAWWHEDVIGHAEVRYIRGRVRFLTGGPYRASGFFASVVTIWKTVGRTVGSALSSVGSPLAFCLIYCVGTTGFEPATPTVSRWCAAADPSETAGLVAIGEQPAAPGGGLRHGERVQNRGSGRGL